MRVLLGIVLLTTFLIGCKNSEKEEEPKYDMYEPSEMALLMEYMYQYNQELREEVLTDTIILSQFPKKFLEIDSAELTKTFHRDESFENFSKLFISAQRQIYDTTLELPLKERYNNMVNLCISCHQTSCTGPIPRIKKLLIP